MTYYLRIFGQFIIILALFAGVAAFADWPTYRTIPSGTGVVLMTFTHGADRKAFCRKRSPEELAKLPPNMRKPEECPRARPPIYVELDIDGRTVFSESLNPTGIAGDAPSRVYERFVLPAGEYEIAARMRDTPRMDGFDYSHRERVRLAAGQLFMVDFDPAKNAFLFR